MLELVDIRRCGMNVNETTLSSKSQFVKLKHYRSKYGFQHGALAHTEQQAIKDQKMTSLKPFKREDQRYNQYKKRETRNTYVPHQQTTTIEHQKLVFVFKCS